MGNSRGLRMVMCAVAVLAGSGCNPLDRLRARRQAAPAVAQYAVPDDDDHLEWASSEPYAVVVRKSCRTLDVYRYGNRIRSFPAVFGLNNHGRKLYEGDLRTPIGLYAIVDKRPHARWGEFMLLDYPNLQDLHRYWLAVESGDVPRAGDRYAGVGGAVGIHGTDKPELNEKGVDWTWGCISVSNRDIRDLAGLVPVGTLVLIED